VSDELGITFDPVGPVWLIGLAGLVAVMLVVALTLRHRQVSRVWCAGVVALRVLAIMGFIVLLLGPATTDSEAPDAAQNGPLVDVLIDTSASMSREDVGHGETRLGHLRSRWLAPHQLNRLRDVGRVRLHAFDSAVRPIDETDALNADGNATRLAHAVERALDGSASAVLILSDGAATDVRLPNSLAALGRRSEAKDITLFAVAAGSTDAPANTSIYAYATPSRVFEGETVELNAIVQRTHTVGASPIELTVLADGELVERVYSQFDTGERAVRLTVEHDPNKGPARQILYELKLHDPQDDADASDNVHRVVVNYLGRRIRVALFEGQPHWDTRFMIDALADDPRVELIVAQAMSDDLRRVARYAPNGSDATAPSLEELRAPNALGDYDVVILGREVERLLPAESAERLRVFVVEGGGLMFARGRAFGDDANTGGKVDELSPVRWGERFVEPLILRAADLPGGPVDARSMLTDEQAAIQLPHMTGATRVDGVKTAAVVYMHQQPVQTRGGQTPRQAALVGQRVGEGRVLAILAEGLWRWAMLPPRLDEYRAVYRSLVRSSARYLAGGDDLLGDAGISLHADPVNAKTSEPITITLRTRYQSAASLLGTEARVEVIDSQGQRHAVALSPNPKDPTRAAGTYQPQTVGEHAVGLSGRERPMAHARFYVSEASTEAQHQAARPDLLRALVDASQGKLLEGGDVEPLLAVLRHAQPTRASDVRDDVRPTPLPWLVIVVVGLLAVEWFIRRGVGLR